MRGQRWLERGFVHELQLRGKDAAVQDIFTSKKEARVQQEVGAAKASRRKRTGLYLVIGSAHDSLAEYKYVTPY